VRNHQAANMSSSAITVHFSDGVNLSVPARSVASSSGGSTGGGVTTAPSTPTGLTASGTTSSSTNLTWSASSDNVGVTGYEILLGGSVIGTVGGTAATVTGLAASTSYTFAVRAKDAAGNRSGASSSVSVTTSSTGGTGGGSVDATSRIEAESYSGMSGVQTEATSDAGGGDNVGWIGNGDYLRYDGVDFGNTARTQFTARVASGAGAGISGLVTVRLDSRTAAPIGSFAVGNTGGWQNWQSIPANVQGTTGVHTVYLTFESGQPADYVNVNWFTFS
jgi:chitodextrinase